MKRKILTPFAALLLVFGMFTTQAYSDGSGYHGGYENSSGYQYPTRAYAPSIYGPAYVSPWGYGYAYDYDTGWLDDDWDYPLPPPSPNPIGPPKTIEIPPGSAH